MTKLTAEERAKSGCPSEVCFRFTPGECPDCGWVVRQIKQAEAAARAEGRRDCANLPCPPVEERIGIQRKTVVDEMAAFELGWSMYAAAIRELEDE